jgi:hypothetical protein
MDGLRPLAYLLQSSAPKLRVAKVAYCCFSMGQILSFLWSKTAESQLKKVIYGLSLHSSVVYPATLGTLSLAHLERRPWLRLLRLLGFSELREKGIDCITTCTRHITTKIWVEKNTMCIHIYIYSYTMYVHRTRDDIITNKCVLILLCQRQPCQIQKDYLLATHVFNNDCCCADICVCVYRPHSGPKITARWNLKVSAIFSHAKYEVQYSGVAQITKKMVVDFCCLKKCVTFKNKDIFICIWQLV